MNDSKTAIHAKALTARGVRSRLTRAGVDHRPLDISQQGDQVRIEGDDAARRKAFHVLFDAGLSVAPYPGYQLWTKR